MLLGLRSLWEGGVIPPPTPVVEEVGSAIIGASSVLHGGRPVYIKPSKKQPWPGDEIEEDELEEILAMLGIEL